MIVSNIGIDQKEVDAASPVMCPGKHKIGSQSEANWIKIKGIKIKMFFNLDWVTDIEIIRKIDIQQKILPILTTCKIFSLEKFIIPAKYKSVKKW